MNESGVSKNPAPICPRCEIDMEIRRRDWECVGCGQTYPNEPVKLALVEQVAPCQQCGSAEKMILASGIYRCTTCDPLFNRL